MVEFRKINYIKDLDQVIKLIQKDLDPGFTQKLFKWKHLENPFGESYGLLALDGSKIVGVRMFMYWNFLHSEDGSVIRAVRPVDTVVDKDYRGQGLFKKLTLRGLEECKTEYDFIFNTPNENSLPGYLKMGWQKLEQVNYFNLVPINPFSKFLPFKEIDARFVDYKHSYYSSKTISSLKSDGYFQWRYKADKYKIALFPKEGVYVVYSVSSVYLIIHEIFGDCNSVSKKILDSLAKKMGKIFIYYYSNECISKVAIPMAIRRRKPVVVLKDSEKLRTSEKIDFSLADLEAVF